MKDQDNKSNYRDKKEMLLKEKYRYILKENGLKDWRIKWNTGGGLCSYGRKEIWLGKIENSGALFLHEVAHALCNKEKCGKC